MAAGGNIGWGVLAGVLATITGDFLGRVFHVHGDVYICPAAMSIVVISLLVMGVLPTIEAYTLTSLPWALLGAAVVVSAWMQHRESQSAKAETNLPA